MPRNLISNLVVRCRKLLITLVFIYASASWGAHGAHEFGFFHSFLKVTMLRLSALRRRFVLRARRRAILAWITIRMQLAVCLVLGALLADTAVRLADAGDWSACAIVVLLLLPQAYFGLRTVALLGRWPPRVVS